MSASYPTPVYWHAGRGGFREVYEPAEDSFLLVDAQEKDTDRLQLMTSGTASSLVHLNMTSGCLNEFGCPSLQPFLCDLTFRRGGEASVQGCLGRGREVTNRFLPVVAQLLSSKGLFYLITIAENDPGEGESCSSTRAGNERLSVLRFHRS
uniref:Uncharacterized protein n=1 Tax=Sander lucioperca TaxID=283035 RepID=A0A8D0B2X3_SANLU